MLNFAQKASQNASYRDGTAPPSRLAWKNQSKWSVLASKIDLTPSSCVFGIWYVYKFSCSFTALWSIFYRHRHNHTSYDPWLSSRGHQRKRIKSLALYCRIVIVKKSSWRLIFFDLKNEYGKNLNSRFSKNWTPVLCSADTCTWISTPFFFLALDVSSFLPILFCFLFLSKIQTDRTIWAKHLENRNWG